MDTVVYRPKSAEGARPSTCSCSNTLCPRCTKTLSVPFMSPFCCPTCTQPCKQSVPGAVLSTNLSKDDITNELIINRSLIDSVDLSKCVCQECGKLFVIEDLMFCTEHSKYACLRCSLTKHKLCELKDADVRSLEEIGMTKERIARTQLEFAETLRTFAAAKELGSRVCTFSKDICERILEAQAKLASVDSVLLKNIETNSAAGIYVAGGHLVQSNARVGELEVESSVLADFAQIMENGLDTVVKLRLPPDAQNLSSLRVLENTFPNENRQGIEDRLRQVATASPNIDALRRGFVHESEQFFKEHPHKPKDTMFAVLVQKKFFVLSYENGSHCCHYKEDYFLCEVNGCYQLALFTTRAACTEDDDVQSQLPQHLLDIASQYIDQPNRAQAVMEELEKTFGGRWACACGDRDTVQVAASEPPCMKTKVTVGETDFIAFQI